MSDFVYKAQQVDYLGFLEAQLRDLQGIDRLAFELIQNADDVQPEGASQPLARSSPTRLSFDVTDTALVVESDGVFRSLDFQRMQSIAGGGKRDEPDTTGAFGLGFIAVYQVTDAPEIFSNNLHWVIHPEAEPERRIQERQLDTTGTRFVLPWAFDGASPVRRALRIEPVDRDALDTIAAQFAAAIGMAAIFLKQLRILEVHRNGALLRRVERAVEGEHLTLTEAGGETATFLFLQGDFAPEAVRLREEYAWQIEEKRHATVTVAIPDTSLPSQGRLFAVLPTDSTMPLPLYISADFFPTTDRRRIHFDEGYQARWNMQALTCAARLLAENLLALREALQPGDLWLLLQRALQTWHSAERQELPEPFATFWQALSPQLSQEPLVYGSDGRWYLPDMIRIVKSEEAHDLLLALGIIPVHVRLQSYFELLRRDEVGVADITLDDIAGALKRQDLRPGLPLDQTTGPLRTLESWRHIWRLIDDLLQPMPPHEQRKIALQQFGAVPIVLSEQMTLNTLRRIYRGDEETHSLFPDVLWLNDLLEEESFPARLVSNFGAREAVDHLAAMAPEQLQEMWQMSRLDLPRLFRWLEAHQIEIFADDPALQRDIRNLPLAPIEGQLRPLAHLYIPGGFEDPLHLAAVVDVEALGGRRQFLQDLGLQELDFETYVHTHIPRVLAQNPDLPSDARHRLLQLLAERLGHIRDDDELRQQLGRLPLVACMDGSFRPARTVYASREAAALLGSRIHIAEPPANQAVAALYRWLGVRREPATADLVRVILDISQDQLASHQPLTDLAVASVLRCWQQLDQNFGQDTLPAEQLAQLRVRRTLPNRARVMSEPGRLLHLDQPELLERFAVEPRELDKFLLLEPGEFVPLMQAAGVRPLSDALQVQVTGSGEAKPAVAVERRILERRPLLARLLGGEAWSGQDDDPLKFLRSLHVAQMPLLQLGYYLPVGNVTLESEPAARAAVYIENEKTLYIDAGVEPPWAAIARELAAVIRSSSPGSLALGIREVLSAATYEDAAAMLDDLGYP